MNHNESSQPRKDSPLFQEILAVVQLLKLENTMCDAYDHRSIATKLEALFIAKSGKVSS